MANRPYLFTDHHHWVLRIASAPGAYGRVAASVRVTRWLSARGYPCTEPAPGVDGPLTVDGRVVSVWLLAPTAPAEPSDGTALGHLLKDLHARPAPPFRRSLSPTPSTTLPPPSRKSPAPSPTSPGRGCSPVSRNCTPCGPRCRASERHRCSHPFPPGDRSVRHVFVPASMEHHRDPTGPVGDDEALDSGVGE
ncbi:phosphotransferase [Streptomyces uncialis]|uniref:phosphotransferase n=1 Tax=Streptomyces uncialis TaxID=1048205 RepID=UPI00364D169B